MIQRNPLSWPLNQRRTPSADRKRAQFKNYGSQVTVAVGVSRIEAALDAYTRVGHSYRIPPDTIIISTNVINGVKGKPLSSQPEPDDPGVAVYFQLDGVDYCLPCDKWNRVADNLAAIAAHINAMRGIEHWGVASSSQVYTDFKALPENAGATAHGDWWVILRFNEIPTLQQAKQSRDKLVAYYHPDKPTGNRDMFELVQKAWEQAQAYYKEK